MGNAVYGHRAAFSFRFLQSSRAGNRKNSDTVPVAGRKSCMQTYCKKVFSVVN